MRHIPLVFTLAALTALPALAAGVVGLPAIPGDDLTVNLVEGPRLIPADVRYRWINGGLEVSGRIQKRQDHYGRILGHVEIELLDAHGGVVGRHSGALQYFSPRRKDPDWAFFRTPIEPVPPRLAAIRVQHAVGARD